MPIGPPSSARRDELLERAYSYIRQHGLAELSLRPLAKAIGSSPRVLLFLFGSKDGLLRALIERARSEELDLLAGLDADADIADTGRAVWRWLVADEHRPLLSLWTEAYARSLHDRTGPWAGFARATVDDWLELLASVQPAAERASADAVAERTLVLAVLRGAMLDLLATGERERTSAAVERALGALARIG
jgi:AcrR family transcriptional regulator